MADGSKSKISIDYEDKLISAMDASLNVSEKQRDDSEICEDLSSLPEEVSQELLEYFPEFEPLQKTFDYEVPSLRFPNSEPELQEIDNKLVLWFDMPGLCEDDVTIKFKRNILMIRAEGFERPIDFEQTRRLYWFMEDLSEEISEEYDPSAYKVEMKNGVLKMEISKMN
ncbi:hypothetical protein POM88_014980 [Heracleum sosnowskyi]|uniref:SHSP domain-containing protein n=1 Tax=Heracleum sosnowskyi TaxID=360622 RepID=A0AAD8ILY1_9APIA|nr:hypothetical protein POM88_014980 [Heracleum sosnowskyi]